MIRRILLFLVVTALLVGVCVWLADNPGTVTIHWQGWRLDTSVSVLLFALVLITIVLSMAQHLVGGLWRIPSHWLELRRQSRRRRGYLALSDGLAAVACGDAPRARKLATQAQKLLNDPQVTGLLTAQAAGLSGDETAARRHYQSLLDRPETALTGCLGMLTLAMNATDWEQALDWARRAWATGSGQPSLAETLYDLQGRAGQWAEAELTVIEALRRKAMGKERAGKLRAVALVERALHVQTQGTEGALALALDAHKYDPRCIPAAVLAARLLSAGGKVRRAEAVLHDSWTLSSHPDIAQTLADLVTDETPLDRVSRLHRSLGRTPPPSGLLALAKAEIDAQLWGQARTHLEAVIKTHPHRSAYVLLAALEQGEKADGKLAAHWLELAGRAAQGDHWVCQSCGEHSSDWTAACPHCGHTASLIWSAR